MKLMVKVRISPWSEANRKQVSSTIIKTRGAAAVDENEVHLLGRQGQFLGRWRRHGAGDFRCDIVEGWGFYFC